jgi:hypothetical protein
MNSIKEPKPKNQEGPTNRLQTQLIFTRLEVLFRVVHYSYIENLHSLKENGSWEKFGVLCGCELYKFTVREETFEPTFLASGSQLKVGALLVVNI